MIRMSALGLVLLLGACSSGDGDSKGGVDSGTADQHLAQPDGRAGADGAPPAPDATAPPVDGTAPVDGPLTDQPITPADALSVDAGPPSGNETCAGAQPLTFTGGAAQVVGSTAAAKDDLSLSAPSCVKAFGSTLSYTTPGKDLFYSVQLSAGQSYSIELDCASKTPKVPNCVFYVLTSCQSPGPSCLLGGLADSAIWPVTGGTLTPSSSGTFIIGVDALGGPGGAFTLTIK